ncbi:hypothetical protein [Lentiprolixibacter aurantiacus]|uniref:Uncharacterized protein n=1 Tax=Lentiprolixibacter aurantiacus TaxID=2993939 RepID=A0AAE3SPL7_9FLAO|nr:hypothetical protein [Lentiprolixibacter aurantiacus]MCX2720376.1 hypothetical protein [Lentiprolixibacter aurantiacus]
MKNQNTYRFTFYALMAMLFLGIGSPFLYAQNQKKNRLRLRADYVRIMDKDAYLNIKASARIDGKNENVPNIELEVYNEIAGEEKILGNTVTDMNGECTFILKESFNLQADSTNTYNLGVAFKGNDAFRKASRTVNIKEAQIIAEYVTIDSLNYISALLKETATDSVLEGKSLSVQVQRLFRPLRIGEQFNFTDENGTILVPIEEGIPGIDGKLNIEVVLSDSDTYGTLKDVVVADVGTPIEFDTSFDKRNMWSSRDKTPLFLLIFVNAIIFVIWGFFAYLIINLFKISKN